MKKTDPLHIVIGAAKAHFEEESDIALANRLHITKQALWNYKAGDAKMPDLVIARLSELADVPLHMVLAAANFAVETDEKKQEFWYERLQGIAAAAGTTMAVFVVVNAALTESPADPLLAWVSALSACILCSIAYFVDARSYTGHFVRFSTWPDLKCQRHSLTRSC